MALHTMDRLGTDRHGPGQRGMDHRGMDQHGMDHRGMGQRGTAVHTTLASTTADVRTMVIPITTAIATAVITAIQTTTTVIPINPARLTIPAASIPLRRLLTMVERGMVLTRNDFVTVPVERSVDSMIMAYLQEMATCLRRFVVI